MYQGDFQANNQYARFGSAAIDASADERRMFIRKTYTHLMMAVYALVALEFLYFKALPVESMVQNLFSVRWGWLLLFGGYMVISTIADRWARSDASPAMQYAGLLTYVFAFSVILCPMLWFANQMSVPIGESSYNTIAVAGIVTLAVFGVLTATVFLTRADFSFLGPILGISGLLIFGAIILGMFGLFNLGVGFSMLLVVFAVGAILYDTSNILHHYRTDQYVAASLKLFASVGLLFWYILQIVMSFSSRD